MTVKELDFLTSPGRGESGVASLAILFVLLAVFPLVYRGDFLIHLGTVVLLACIGSVGLHVILRTGHVFMAHGAFMGLGAYTSVILVMQAGVPFPLAMIAAIVAPALVALVVGPIVLRLRGVYFVLISFALGEIARITFANSTITGGTNGIFGIPAPSPVFMNSRNYYYLALAAMVVATVFVYRVVNSEFGRSLDAIREGEPLAASTGVPVPKFKVIALVIAAALAGLEGCLTAHYIRYISPLSFTFDHSLTYVVMNVLGGTTHWPGALIGAFIIVPLPELLRGFVEYQRILYGIILVLTMAFAPTGLTGIAEKFMRSRQLRRYGGTVTP